jgi:hypothetical protein
VAARVAGCGVRERAAQVFNVSMWKLLQVGEPIMAPLLTYLAGLPLCFLPTPNPQARPKIHRHRYWVAIGWPTSLIGGERPGGSEFGCVGT